MAGPTLEEMTKFDDIFLGILQKCGRIEAFLDAIFYFLSRRTDFFILMHTKNDKMGFPTGIAERMLIKMFRKHQETILKKDAKYMAWKNSQKQKENETVPTAINEVEVKTSVGEPSSNQEASTNQSKENHFVKTTDSGTKSEDNTQSKDDTTTTDQSQRVVNSGIEKGPNKSQLKDTRTEDKAKSNQGNQTLNSGGTKPKTGEKESANSSKQKDSDTYNGGVTDHYSWSQTISDVDIKISVPATVTKGKDLSIEILADSMKVSLKHDPPADCEWKDKLLVEGKLSNKIRCAESLWTLTPGRHVVVTLEKIEEKFWTCVFDGDVEIDKQSIDTTQQVTDFNEQTQADIRKLMYDQQQKMMGKPTSDEQKTHDLLKKAWDVEGSPFKGTPFDPSVVNICGNGMPPMPPDSQDP